MLEPIYQKPKMFIRPYKTSQISKEKNGVGAYQNITHTYKKTHILFVVFSSAVTSSRCPFWLKTRAFPEDNTSHWYPSTAPSILSTDEPTVSAGPSKLSRRWVGFGTTVPLQVMPT